MYEIRLFGGLEVRTRGVRLAGRGLGGVESRRILALLALHGELGVTDLADLLWDGSPPAGHRAALATHVSVLRCRLDPDRVGGPSLIAAGGMGYALDPDRFRTDVARFDELMAAAMGRTALRAVPPLTAAVHLAGRPLLAGDEGGGWVAEARAHYRGRLVEALLGAADHALVTGEPTAALGLAGRVLELEPFAERGWYVTIAAYRALGDRAAALQAYDERLRQFVGVLAAEPSTPARYLDVLRAGGSRPGDGGISGVRDRTTGRRSVNGQPFGAPVVVATADG